MEAHRNPSQAPLPNDVLSSTEDDENEHYFYRPGEVIVTEAALDDSLKMGLVMGSAHQVWRDGRLGLRGFRFPWADAVPGLVQQFRDRYYEAKRGDLSASDFSANVVLGLGGHSRYPCATPPQPADLSEHPAITPPGESSPDGTKIAVVSTGVAADHPWLKDRTNTRGAEDTDVADADHDGMLDAAAGHGTFEAGRIALYAPDAMIVARRAASSDGFIDDHQLAETLLNLPKVDVINLSLGGFTPDDLGLLATRKALDWLFETNPELVVVASAGNHGQDRKFFPAADERVVAVGAVDENTKLLPQWTGHGDWVNVYAPGGGVVSSFLHWYGPMARPNEEAKYEDFGGYATWSGTSFSAPVVAAAAARRHTELVGTSGTLTSSAGADRVRAIVGELIATAEFDQVLFTEPKLEIPDSLPGGGVPPGVEHGS